MNMYWAANLFKKNRIPHTELQHILYNPQIRSNERGGRGEGLPSQNDVRTQFLVFWSDPGSEKMRWLKDKERNFMGFLSNQLMNSADLDRITILPMVKEKIKN